MLTLFQGLTLNTLLACPWFIIGGIITGMSIRQLLAYRTNYQPIPLDSTFCGIAGLVILLGFSLAHIPVTMVTHDQELSQKFASVIWVTMFCAGLRIGYQWLILRPFALRKKVVGIHPEAIAVHDDGVVLVNPTLAYTNKEPGDDTTHSTK
jgi:hypothetical protein